MDRACYFKHIADKRFSEFSNLPHLKNYILNLRPEFRIEFYSGLAEIANIRCEDQRYIEQAELATIATILHYIESLFVMYDRDRTGVLNGYEVLAAFPRFHHFLGEQVTALTGQVYDVAYLKSIFTFLVREGRFPSESWPQSWSDKAAITSNRHRYFDQEPEQFTFANLDPMRPADRPSAPNLALNRMGLLNVLAMLNGVTRNDATPCPQK